MIPHQIVDRYRLLREIGRGGIGMVFEAEDLELSRHVALKLIQPEHARDRELEERFLREARALARVPHPSIVRIYSFGVLDDGTQYLVMELLTGESLAQRWHRTQPHTEPPRIPAELTLVQQTTEAIAALHQAGVFHRDLKPDNIMVIADNMSAPGHRAKLIDFGLAKIPVFSGQRSASELIMGTVKFFLNTVAEGWN